jgi:GntR family transcriptional repressor for pyruvate dehydrogenase complex
LILNKEVLAIKVVREVISLISTGVYAPGKKLPAERKLCETLGVSRGTLRQGLADLESLGVIKIMPRSGAYVKKYVDKQLPGKVLPPNFKEVNLADIINARKIIEIPALKIACKNAAKADIKTLKVLIDKMEKTIDNLPGFLQNDMAFHQAIVAMSKNLVLVTAFESISEYLKYSQVYSSIHEGEEEKALGFHKKIFESIKKKDVRGGVKILGQHLDEIMESSKL